MSFSAWTETGAISRCPESQPCVLPQDLLCWNQLPWDTPAVINFRSDRLSAPIFSLCLGWLRHTGNRLITSSSTVGNCTRFLSSSSFSSSLPNTNVTGSRAFLLILQVFNHVRHCEMQHFWFVFLVSLSWLIQILWSYAETSNVLVTQKESKTLH